MKKFNCALSYTDYTPFFVWWYKEFFKKKLKVRLNVSNIFNNVGWKGYSEFDGLKSYGNGRFDNHFVSLSLNYNFGNKNVKSRKRKTGLESESKRVN